MGAGYPEHRKESQRISRETLRNISRSSHRSIDEILESTDQELLAPLARSESFLKLIAGYSRTASFLNAKE
jgi:hypothetical protein